MADSQRLELAHGTLRLVGELVDQAAAAFSVNVPDELKSKRHQRDGSASHHVTLISKHEADAIVSRQGGTRDEHLQTLLQRVGGLSFSWRALGLGSTSCQGSRAFFVALGWPELSLLRASYGLHPCTLHITCGFMPRDVHGVAKGCHFLLPGLCNRAALDVYASQLSQLDTHGYELPSELRQKLADEALIAQALADEATAPADEGSQALADEATAPADEGSSTASQTSLQIATLLAAASEEDVPALSNVFPPLPPLDALTARIGSQAALRSIYTLPSLARCNWVVPGRIMCGDCGALVTHARELCAAGVTTIVNLQTKGERDAVPYHHGVLKLNSAAKFVELPIKDQQTTDDARVSALVLSILSRVGDGEVFYIHCRGGHGRTGTVCSILLGAIHSLAGQVALCTFQCLHDLRAQPCFHGHGEPRDLSFVTALFDVQKAQVCRLLGGDAEVAPAPLCPQKDLSAMYGQGASKYDEETLQEWQSRGVAASKAAKQRDWTAACLEFEACVSLRPDWEKGVACLLKARSKRREAAQVDGDGGRRMEEAVTSATVAATPASSKPLRRLGAHVPLFVVLAGLPGAGKSTFAKALAHSREEWLLIDSDETGGRRETEAAVCAGCKSVTAAAKRGGGGKHSRLIVDKCNVRTAERASLLALALPLLPQKPDTTVVYFATETATCIERVASRTDHPSIPYGHGRPAVQSMAKALELPAAVAAAAQAKEGAAWRSVEVDGLRWIVVNSFEQVNALLSSWGAGPAEIAPAGFKKFPRTRHVLNTGGSAVTRDDLVMDPADARRFYDGITVVYAEEKVDGANLGLSLTAAYEIRVQNRSHYVNERTHAQFKALGRWLDEHGWALCRLLEPEVEILFGEWCAAKHSCAYTKLPGLFLAFDLYNKRSGKFASVAERDRRLSGLGIPIVRTLACRAFAGEEELLQLLESTSAYSDGFVEGSYLRIDGATENRLRGKLVRPDFIQGIGDHWASGGFARNGVRPDLWVEKE